MSPISFVNAISLGIVMLSGLAITQSGNLLKNPSSDDGLQSWNVFGNASAADCTGFGKCFTISQDGFIFQDIDVAADSTGQFAVLIAFSSIEEINGDVNRPGRPYLYGYFMTSSELPKAKILSKLTGQEMATQPLGGDWAKQFGVFRVVEGTRSIRIFLRSGCPKTATSVVCSSRFRKPGIFLFRAEEAAKAFVDTYQ